MTRINDNNPELFFVLSPWNTSILNLENGNEGEIEKEKEKEREREREREREMDNNAPSCSFSSFLLTSTYKQSNQEKCSIVQLHCQLFGRALDYLIDLIVATLKQFLTSA